MNLLAPDLSRAPGARIIVNSLYDSKEPGFLTQDLLLVELPAGAHVDVSWFPKYDPSGAYTVTVFHGQDDIYHAEVPSAQEAVRLVERLAYVISERVSNVSCSSVEISAYGSSQTAGNVSCSHGQSTDYRPAA